MADSTTNLDLISSGQSAKEVTANELFDAGSPATTLGRRASTTAGLTWGYYGGVIRLDSGSLHQIANGTKTLTNNATNYLELDTTDGSVDLNTTSFTAGKVPLYEIIVASGAVTSYEDMRALYGAAGSGGTDAEDVAVDDAGGYFTGADVEAVLQEIGTELASQPFDVLAFYPGIPTASAKVVRVPIARAVTFAANFAGSYFTASANATGTTVFDVQKNGSSIGSVSIAAGGTTATFTTSGGTSKSFSAGDVLALIAPSTPDATLADVGFALAGTR